VIRNITAILILAFCVFLSIKALAQRRDDNRDYNDNSSGLSASNWTMDRSEDRMTAERHTRFELRANDTRDGDDHAQVMLYCSDGKLKLADFHPNIRLSRPNWAGFWGQPQMHIRVRADNAHDDRTWNWVNGHFLAMDKTTARRLVGAHLFRIEFNTPEGPRIAEFSPSGLDLRLVHDACGLEPKR
jgi:hypothetical protein